MFLSAEMRKRVQKNEETVKNNKSGGKPAFPTLELTFVDAENGDRKPFNLKSRYSTKDISQVGKVGLPRSLFLFLSAKLSSAKNISHSIKVFA